ncbi:MAG TPA: hypothetical protein H9936_00390 [Candidatus Agathobaculum intestinigallinarum]|nr:hypothetical protein [Candidatus Agathobaculum intestinigallinarum]
MSLPEKPLSVYTLQPCASRAVSASRQSCACCSTEMLSARSTDWRV